ncbi:flagellin [Pseudoalteromonas sp. N1230-9]|uniref:flagellin n=1 Tax=Pseudoalteromonas sp. N1230-9 TaxID=2907156 RepID=UPI002B323718|nr:flagellin [Pseudoalteromonas sp. N1230-9]
MLVQGSEKPTQIESVKSSKASVVEQKSSVSASDVKQSAKNTAPEQGQVAVLSRWAKKGQLSQAMAQVEHREMTIKQLYSGLEKLAQQLKSMPSSAPVSALQSHSMTQQITQLQQQASAQSSGLNSQLKVQQPNAQVVRQLNSKVDLISQRPHDESIHLLLGRSGKAVHLQLPANQSEAENLNTIAEAFAKQQINVEVNRDNRLLFTTSPEYSDTLKESWVITGQGVRVAAGNPISLQLSELASPLDQLEESVKKQQDVSAHLDFINRAQRQLKANLLQIQAQHRELTAQLQQIEKSADVSGEQMTQLSQSLKSKMLTPNVDNIAVITAQANMTRSMVKYALA